MIDSDRLLHERSCCEAFALVGPTFTVILLIVRLALVAANQSKCLLPLGRAPVRVHIVAQAIARFLVYLHHVAKLAPKLVKPAKTKERENGVVNFKSRVSSKSSLLLESRQLAIKL